MLNLNELKDFIRQRPDIRGGFQPEIIDILWHDVRHFVRQNYVPDLSKRKHASLSHVIHKKLENRELPLREQSLVGLRERRKDILFLLGTNRSANEIDDSTWEKIGRYDSMGFNYWFFHKFVPTYYSLEYGHDPKVNRQHIECIKKISDKYRDVIFLIHSHSWRQGLTPKVFPEYFPPNPRYLYFTYPMLVSCPDERVFVANDFTRAMMYRGSLNLHLYIARLIGYKKIVLVGNEMDTKVSLYDDLPEAQWIFDIPGYEIPKEERAKVKYGGAYVSKGKHNYIDTIHAINDYVFKPENIELYVFDKRSLLYPRVPLFEF